MSSILRREDEKCSEIVSAFLDKNFYNKCDFFERVFDKERQISGIDVIFEKNNEKYICDEKSAIRYVNRFLKTYSMELSFINRKNELNLGWLLDESKINNSFAFIYIDKAKHDSIQSENDIEQVEIIIVKKNKILNYLNNLGLDKKKLIEFSIFLRNNEKCNFLIENGLKIICSKKLFEKPVNILIPRLILRQLSDFRNEISIL